MSRRRWVAVVLVAAVLGGAAEAVAQQDRQRELARELAHLMLDNPTRRGVDEQVGASMMQAIGLTLQQRLNRRLLEMEWRMVGEIVQRFVGEVLPSSRTEALAAEVYMRHFSADELEELLRFQRSPVGRKAAELTPTIRLQTVEAMDREIRDSPALPGMLAELRHAFPVLGGAEGP